MAVWTQASTLYARIRRRAGPSAAPARRSGDPRAAPRAVRGPEPAPRAARRLARAGGRRGRRLGRDRPGRAGARRRHVHDDRARHDPSARRRRLRVGGRRARRLRLPGARGRRVDGLRGRGLPGPPGGDPRGGEQPVAEPAPGVATLSQAGTDTVLSDLVVDPSGPTYALMLAGVRGNDPATPGGARVRARERRGGGRSRRGRRGAAAGGRGDAAVRRPVRSRRGRRSARATSGRCARRPPAMH